MIIEVVALVSVTSTAAFFLYRRFKPKSQVEITAVEAEIKVIDHSLSKVANTISRLG